MVQQQFEARSAQNQAGITGAYDSGLAAQKQSLLDAYNANAAAQQNAGQTVRQTGATLGNDVSVQNARNTGNINQFADARGVNRQQGSQAALSLGNARTAAMGDIAYRQQTALAENQRQQDLAKAQYQAQVQSAIADKDYKQAAALLDNYNNENKWRDQQAAMLASYGNFDPYRNMYGDGAADAMRNVWVRQNPDIAYQTGALDPETYKQITGRYPEGYVPPAVGGGFDDGWYGGTPGAPDSGILGAPGGNGKGGFESKVASADFKNGTYRAPMYTPTAINARERY